MDILVEGVKQWSSPLELQLPNRAKTNEAFPTILDSSLHLIHTLPKWGTVYLSTVMVVVVVEFDPARSWNPLSKMDLPLARSR